MRPYFATTSNYAATSLKEKERPMPWIKQIAVEDATGVLKKQFDAAIKRAGRVWNIVHIMSLNPPALKYSIEFYSALMFGKSPLSRVQREMLAVVVAKELGCHY